MDRQPVAIVNLDDDVERRRRLALEHGLARAAPARFFVGERHRADAADQVGERRVHQQVLERLPVRGADQRDAALGDRARGDGLGLGADLVDDDDFGHVVFDRFDHHGVLQGRVGDLHAPREPDAGMRNVAVAGDFVRGIDDDDALAVFGKHARALAQHRRLSRRRGARAGRSTCRCAARRADVDRSVDGASDAARQPDDLAGAIADRADAMQRLLDAGAVVGAERRDARADVRDIFVRDRRVGKIREVVFETRLGRTPEIEHDFDDIFDVVETDERLPDREGEDVEELGELPARGDGWGSNRQY